MKRKTGTYRVMSVGGEEVRAFIPHPLPPAQPALLLKDSLQSLLAVANAVGAESAAQRTGWFATPIAR